MEYYPWLVEDEDDSLAGIFDFPRIIEKKGYLLNIGVSVKEWFPDDLVIDFDKSKGDKLSDSIPNYSTKMVISAKLKSILEEKSDAQFEYFPVRLRNKKNKLIEEPYFMANLLDTVERVNMNKSKFVMDALVKDQVDWFTHLYLDKKKIPHDKKIFRPKVKKNLILVREDLAQDILRAKCTGMLFRYLDDYGSEYR